MGSNLEIVLFLYVFVFVFVLCFMSIMITPLQTNNQSNKLG